MVLRLLILVCHLIWYSQSYNSTGLSQCFLFLWSFAVYMVNPFLRPWTPRKKKRKAMKEPHLKTWQERLLNNRYTSLDFFRWFWTPMNIAIVMKYANGGELFEHICSAGRFREDDVSLTFIDETIYIVHI